MRERNRRAGLSIVIPAWNEAGRLPAYLGEVVPYLESTSVRYEVVVVDDGSDDGLADAILPWLYPCGPLHLLRHASNQGKGAAVATGVRITTGELVLFADADGATPIAEERRLRTAINDGADVAIGTRRIAGTNSRSTRRPLRRMTGAIFPAIVRLWLDMPYRDTQCGFKMFRRPVAERLFSLMREQRYLFDIELLWWARKLGYCVAEVPVTWSEQPRGQLRVFRDGLSMLVGLERLRRRLRRFRKDTFVGRPHFELGEDGRDAVTVGRASDFVSRLRRNEL